MIFNGLIALGTVAGQTAYSVFAFNCPCSSGRNYRYGLAAIGVPALAFFLIGIMMNKSTWDLVSECRLRRCRKLSGAAGFALMGNIIGRAVVAPLTWAVISLLQGQAYTCALSEFVERSELKGFPVEHGSEVMAKFPCEENIPTDLQPFLTEIQRQLKYESQRTSIPASWLQRTSRTSLASWLWTEKRRSSWRSTRAFVLFAARTGTE